MNLNFPIKPQPGQPAKNTLLTLARGSSETSGLVDNDELQYDEQEMEVEPYTPYISSTENPVSPSKRDSVRYLKYDSKPPGSSRAMQAAGPSARPRGALPQSTGPKSPGTKGPGVEEPASSSSSRHTYNQSRDKNHFGGSSRDGIPSGRSSSSDRNSSTKGHLPASPSKSQSSNSKDEDTESVTIMNPMFIHLADAKPGSSKMKRASSMNRADSCKQADSAQLSVKQSDPVKDADSRGKRHFKDIAAGIVKSARQAASNRRQVSQSEKRKQESIQLADIVKISYVKQGVKREDSAKFATKLSPINPEDMMKEPDYPEYTVDDAIELVGLGRYQIVWFVLLGLSSMSQASEIALASVILNDLMCKWKLSLLQASLIPALILLAALPGGYIGGVLADKKGRKMVIIIGQWIILVFGVLSAFMTTFVSFVLIRMMVGFGFGIVTSLVIVHVSEIAPPRYRAYSVAVNVFMWSAGDCFVVLMGYYTLSHGWQVVVLAASIPSIVMSVLILFLDESPKYLTISNNVKEASRVLEKIALLNMTELPKGRLIAKVEPVRGNVKEMFNNEFRQTSLLLISSVFIANLVYYGNIFSLPYLFKNEYCSSDANTTVDQDCTFSKSELVATLEVSAAEFLSIPIFAFLCETLGRLKTSSLLGIVTAVATAACVPCLGNVLLQAELFIQRSAVNAWLLLFFIYAPELYPTYIRSSAFGVVMMFCNLGGALSSLLVYNVGVHYSYRAMFLLFTPFAVAGAVMTFFFRNETKGKVLVDNKSEIKGNTVDDLKCCDREAIACY